MISEVGSILVLGKHDVERHKFHKRTILHLNSITLLMLFAVILRIQSTETFPDVSN